MPRANLRDIMDDPDSQLVVGEIMKEIGLGKPLEEYDGESALDKRIEAAEKLEGAIRKFQAHGLDEPNEELLKYALVTAERLEIRTESLRTTYEVIRLITFGHILLGYLKRTGAKRLDWICAKDSLKSLLMDVIDKQKPLARSYGGGKCDDCDEPCGSGGGGGGCGSCGGCGP